MVGAEGDAERSSSCGACDGVVLFWFGRRNCCCCGRCCLCDSSSPSCLSTERALRLRCQSSCPRRPKAPSRRRHSSLLSAVKFFKASLPSLRIDESDSSELGDETFGSHLRGFVFFLFFFFLGILGVFSFPPFLPLLYVLLIVLFQRSQQTSFLMKIRKKSKSHLCRWSHGRLVPLSLQALHCFLALQDQFG